MLKFFIGLVVGVIIAAPFVGTLQHFDHRQPIVLPLRPIDRPLILPKREEALSGTIVVVVPPEPVRREGLLMIAKEVTGAVTITLGDKTYIGTLTFPDTAVRRTGVGAMTVDQCEARGCLVPAESQAQRGYLYSNFGKAWVKRHGFDNKGKLPEHVKKKEPKKKESK